VGVQEGDQVQLALEGDSIRILTRSRALRELRAKVQQFVPEGVSLADELIAERQAEAAKDPMNG
jgi:antitoxin component of MazEF toxin-antitoxin module